MSEMGIFRQLTLVSMLSLCAEVLARHGTNHKAITSQLIVRASFRSFPCAGTQCVGCVFFLDVSASSEYSSDLEEELSVAVVADGPSGFHRSKPCIDDECPNDVTRNVGGLGTARELVRLADLEGS